MTPNLPRWIRSSIRNRRLLMQYPGGLGCFSCLESVTYPEIEKWQPHPRRIAMKNDTAICPKCFQMAIVPTDDEELLKLIHEAAKKVKR